MERSSVYSLEHWDVNNENLHGAFFEGKTGDANITMKIFEDVYALDSTAKLFLNDFGIMETRGCQKATVGTMVKIVDFETMCKINFIENYSVDSL